MMPLIICLEERNEVMVKPTIILDAGHGGFDAGASYQGRREKDDTLRLALAVGEQLEAMGFPVVYTRTTDIYQRPVDKARIGNQSGGDFFVSIHRNSGAQPNQYNGVQTLVYNDSGVIGQMARNINTELEQVGFNNINVEERKDLAVLRRTAMPALLVEAGFINSDEDNTIFDENFQAMANAIAQGIENTVGGTHANTTSGVQNNMMGRNGHMFGVQVGLFRRYENAQYLLEALIEQDYVAEIRDEKGYFAVVVGQEASLEDARSLERELSAKGYDTLIVSL